MDNLAGQEFRDETKISQHLFEFARSRIDAPCACKKTDNETEQDGSISFIRTQIHQKFNY